MVKYGLMQHHHPRVFKTDRVDIGVVVVVAHVVDVDVVIVLPVIFENLAVIAYLEVVVQPRA